MIDFLFRFFGAGQFAPHGMCLLWRPELLFMHGVSDLLISLAYFSITFLILKAVRLRPDLLHPKLARLFAAFICACALSHLTGLLTLWYPAYWLHGAVKAVTATVSLYTVLAIARLLPDFLNLPSREEITRREMAFEVERRARRQAQEARDKLSEFAYIASHDLKAPMRGIANQAQFLQEDFGDALAPEARRRLDRMQELCAQLDTLISTLLNYSRIGRSDAREPVSPQKTIAAIESSLAEFLVEKNATLRIETALPQVRANPSDVTTVFQNLIVNGLTYNTADQKEIAIGFRPEVEVNGQPLQNAYYVKDNGIGIDPEFHDDVFKMFKRLNAPEAFGEGTGAGLSFVQKVIEGNGGEIRLHSVPGEGSTFYFTFPDPGGPPPREEGNNA